MATQQLADATDLDRLGPPIAALASKSTEDKNAALLVASGEAAAFIRKRFTFPLVSWGDEIKGKVIDIAVAILLYGRGFDPTAGQGNIVVDRAAKAMAWLLLLAKGTIEVDIVDSTVVEEAGVLASTQTLSDWRAREVR